MTRNEILAASAGVAIIAEGVLIRAGRLREGVINMYGNESAWRFRRNAIFSLIPWGLSLVLGAAAVASGTDTNQSPLEITLLVATMVSFLVGVAFAIHPPGFVKPRWLREHEDAPLPPIEVGPIRYYGPWVVLAVTAVVLFVVGAPIQMKLGLLLVGAPGVASMHRRLRRK